MFDRKCAMLAASFLEDDPDLSAPQRLALEPELAQDIQDAIETWLRYELPRLVRQYQEGVS